MNVLKRRKVKKAFKLPHIREFLKRRGKTKHNVGRMLTA